VRYPAHLASEVVLRDGSTVTLRPVRADDAPLLLEFFRTLDERSLAFRFFTGAPGLERVTRMLADVDHERRFGLVALRGAERRPVGHGFFAAIDDELVEIAFAVGTPLQGKGLGTVLLAQLAERALEVGFERMVADVLPANHAMISMFRDSGFPVEVRSEAESVVVEMPTSPTPESIARFQERDAIAARAAVASFFDPDAVAAVDGPVEVTLGWARGSADDLRALVVRGDPDEWSPPGSEAECELLEICRRAGTRLIGPASVGLLDNRPGRGLDLTAEGARPPGGAVGVVAQGAGAGRAILEGVRRHRVGLSVFVSLGSRADVTANDLLEYWEEDPATEVAILQVESFSDPRRFGRIAPRVAARMPIIVIAERSAAEPPGLGLFDQVGAIRADGVDQALDLALDLAEPTRRQGLRQHRHALPPATVFPSDEAAAILATALGEGRDELDPHAAARLLDRYGITVDVSSREFGERASPRITVGTDPLFGPVLRCGPADIPAARLPARLCPLAEADAIDLLKHWYPTDPTYSSSGPRSPAHVLVGAAAAASAHAEIASLELERVLATADGVVARGARVRVHRPPQRRPWPRTWK
jgi:RimJ/RimL family protein N-acetyltransferase